MPEKRDEQFRNSYEEFDDWYFKTFFGRYDHLSEQRKSDLRQDLSYDIAKSSWIRGWDARTQDTLRHAVASENWRNIEAAYEKHIQELIGILRERKERVNEILVGMDEAVRLKELKDRLDKIKNNAAHDTREKP